MQCTQCKVLAYFFDVTGGDKAIKHTIKYTKKCNRHRWYKLHGNQNAKIEVVSIVALRVVHWM